MAKVRAFLIIAVGVFLGSAIPVFLINLTNIWTIPLTTWQIIITAGLAGVATWLLAVVVPVAIKPSAGLKFPSV
jgi:hypothetical protein